MMRILVMQTTRMGDVIQTSPLVSGIRARHPDAEISMMVRRMGKAVAERIPDISEVLVYDEDEMFINLGAQDSDRLLKAYERAEAYINMIRERRFDVAYNCTHSIASAMLLKLAGVPEVIGAHLSDDWQFVLRGPWTNYFFTSVFHREHNDLNLCDMTRRFVPNAPPQAALVFDVRDEDRAFAAELLERHGINTKDFLVCMQLGASEENKRWAESHFAALARMLADRRNAKIVQLGVQEEERFGKIFEQHAPGLAVPLFGKTNLPQLAAVLEQANLLVTNDTGTMHVAAAVGCPIVLVSVGYVHFRETGPYGPGHIAIERRRAIIGRADGVPGGLDERTLILPEHVYRAIEVTLDGPKANLEENVDSIDLFRSEFAPDGCLEWYPLLRRPLRRKDFIRAAYRAMWLDYLASHADANTEHASLERLFSHFTPPDEGTVEVWRDELCAAFAALAGMAQRGIDQSQRLIQALEKKRIREAQDIVPALTALDEEMRLHAELNDACRPIVHIAKFERDNLEGANPVVLAQTTLQIYRDCQARARLMNLKVGLAASISARVF